MQWMVLHVIILAHQSLSENKVTGEWKQRKSGGRERWRERETDAEEEEGGEKGEREREGERARERERERERARERAGPVGREGEVWATVWRRYIL